MPMYGPSKSTPSNIISMEGKNILLHLDILKNREMLEKEEKKQRKERTKRKTE